MKKQIEGLVSTALRQLANQGVFPAEVLPQPKIERTKDSSHGDFATNAALVLAKTAGRNPRE
ncbi:MAG: arginine--tRNA ligase, partial [Candidatus Thiodiazotropha sp.]